MENNYYQQEYYLSASVLWRVLDNLSFSLATDGSVNRMNADLRNFAKPVRYSWLTALAGKYVTNWMTLSASVLGTWVHENVERGNSAGVHRKLSPYVGVSFKPFDSEEFHLRAFYKDIFRLPSFNDLYYGQTGNIGLKPEKARQLNVGLTYTKRVCDVIPFLTFTADAYMNRVTDKIVAIPTKNLFVWSMVNLGKVNIKGMDVTDGCDGQPWHPSVRRICFKPFGQLYVSACVGRDGPRPFYRRREDIQASDCLYAPGVGVGTSCVGNAVGGLVVCCAVFRKAVYVRSEHCRKPLARIC